MSTREGQRRTAFHPICYQLLDEELSNLSETVLVGEVTANYAIVELLARFLDAVTSLRERYMADRYGWCRRCAVRFPWSRLWRLPHSCLVQGNQLGQDTDDLSPMYTTAIREWITVRRAVPRHRKRDRAATGTSLPVETPHVIPMVDARTRSAHLVTDDAVAAGRADAGRYVAVCGAVVLAASLTTPEASYCASCAYWRRHKTVPWRAPQQERGWCR